MELSSEAPSVKSGHLSHWRAALTSPALPNPSKVSPTRWLWGAMKTRLFSVVNSSLPATHPYEYQLLNASHWNWGSWKETVPGKSEENKSTTQACSASLPWSFLVDLIATTSSQSASEFLQYFVTFFQPPLVCSHLLDLSIYFFFFFFPSGHDRLFISPHSFLLVYSRQMDKLMITLAKASFAAL